MQVRTSSEDASSDGQRKESEEACLKRVHSRQDPVWYVLHNPRSLKGRKGTVIVRKLLCQDYVRDKMIICSF